MREDDNLIAESYSELLLLLFMWGIATTMMAASLRIPKVWMATHLRETHRLLTNLPTPLSAYPEPWLTQKVLQQWSPLVWMHQSLFHEILSFCISITVPIILVFIILSIINIKSDTTLA